jgi:hypothetical protein
MLSYGFLFIRQSRNYFLLLKRNIWLKHSLSRRTFAISLRPCPFVHRVLTLKFPINSTEPLVRQYKSITNNSIHPRQCIIHVDSTKSRTCVCKIASYESNLIHYKSEVGPSVTMRSTDWDNALNSRTIWYGLTKERRRRRPNREVLFWERLEWKLPMICAKNFWRNKELSTSWKRF